MATPLWVQKSEDLSSLIGKLIFKIWLYECPVDDNSPYLIDVLYTGLIYL